MTKPMTKPATQALRERMALRLDPKKVSVLPDVAAWARGQRDENARLVPIIEALLASRERLRNHMASDADMATNDLLDADDEAMRALIGEG